MLLIAFLLLVLEQWSCCGVALPVASMLPGPWKSDDDRSGDAPSNCGAVIQTALASCSSQTWRWVINTSYNSNGPTIHWMQFGNASGWMHTSGWSVAAKSHPNGPAANLLKLDNTSFWNADQSGTPRDGAPWTVTIKATSVITPSSMRYSIYVAANAPMAYRVECLKDIAWTTVAEVNDAGCRQPLCKCPHRLPPAPPRPPPPPSPRPAGHTKIDTVHYVSSFHLDLGFAIPNGFSAGIFDITWNTDVYHKRAEGYLFQAINTSRALRARGGDEALKFLPPPYLLSLGLDCPPNMTMGTADPLDTVHCPSESKKHDLLRGVADGDIGLWGSPFNQQIEWMMDPSLVEFSVQLVHDMADKYNFPNRGTTFATHDVPGITRAAIPVFKKMGIKAINIGVDRASAVPATGPVCYNSSGGFAYTNDCHNFQSTGRPAFVWRDAPSGEEIITMVNPYGYANLEDGWLEHWLNSTVTVPCSSHALALNWRHDNDGPAGVEEVLDIYAHLRKEFPGAKIIASTLDAFADEMLKAKACLPVVEAEMGDTWSHGPPSDPLKVSMFRTLARKRRQCLEDGRCTNQDYNFYNFSRLLLKNAEHDWGRSGSAMGSDQTAAWGNDAFHARLAIETTPSSGWNSTNNCDPRNNTGPCYLQDMIDSYVEERNWGVYYAQQALNDHPLRSEISFALEELQPHRLDLTTGGWRQVRELGSHFDLGRWSIGFNDSTGAINHLVDSQKSQIWANSTHQLAEFVYQTFTAHDHNVVFMNEYMSDATYNPTMGARLNCDFGKCGMNNTERLDIRPSLHELWIKAAVNCSSKGGDSFVDGPCHRFALHLSVSQHAHTNFGAPNELWMHVDVPADSKARFGITVDMFNKTSTRVVESSSVRFVPAPLSGSPVNKLSMQVSKLGSWVDPSDVALNGSRHLHGLDDTGGVGLFQPDGTLSARIITVDGTTSCVGRYPTPYPTPLGEAFDNSAGFAANIHNNVWNTCYILFYPYLAEDRDLRQRYVMDLDVAMARSPLPWQQQQ